MLPDVLTHHQLLPNGLRSVVVELPHLHTATIVLFAKVGSRFERPPENGLSHFVEHMLYRGTERFPTSYDLNFAFESLGGTLYAETGRDYSLFQVTLVPELVGSGLELFGELFSRPRFSDIELERQLVLEELNEDFDESGVEINSGDIARGLLFGAHPLGQRIIGPRQNVRRFGETDVRTHFERFYCAKNVLLCVAGPVDPARVFSEAEQHLGGLSAGSEADCEPHVPEQERAIYKYVADSGSQTSVTVLFRAIPEADPQYTASVALLRALDDGMSTRLHYRLADQLGLAYSISAGIEPLHDVSLVEVSASTANAKTGSLIERILELLAEFRELPIRDEELEKIRRRYRYDLAASTDDANAMASWFGGTALYYPPFPLGEKAARMDAVTADDIRAAASRIFRPENLTVAVVGSLTRARQAELRSAAQGFR
jgi:predicted Zn-dependent peptidase